MTAAYRVSHRVGTSVVSYELRAVGLASDKDYSQLEGTQWRAYLRHATMKSVNVY